MAIPTHLVLRVLPGPEGDIYGGTRVDAGAWANCRLLESAGYIRPLTDEELTDTTGTTAEEGAPPKKPKKPKKPQEP